MLDFNVAVGDAYRRTRYLVWEQKSWSRWWRYSLLSAMTGSGGGNFHFQVPAGVGGEKKKDLALLGVVLGTGAIGNFDNELLLMFAGIGVLALLLGIFVAWLSSCAQFVFLENVLCDRHRLLEPLGRVKAQGTSLFLFSIGVSLAILLPFFMVAAACGMGLYSQRDDLGMMIAALLFFLACFFGVICLLGAIFSTTTSLLAPIMYQRKISTSQAWSQAWPTLRSRKLDWFLFLLCHLGLTMAGGMVVIFGVLGVVLLVGAVVGLVLGLPAYYFFTSGSQEIGAICLILLVLILVFVILLSSLLLQMPVSVFVRCFGVYALQQFLPECQMLPAGGGGQSLLTPEKPVPSEPGPLGSPLA